MTTIEPLSRVNNAVYETLGERWYGAEDDPIALLRAESRLRNPWLASEMTRAFGARPADVLDIGCGGGFLSNYLGALRHRVTGLDASADALAIASRYDHTGLVRYQQGDALNLPFPDASFDTVCAMDFLEHVEDPDRVIAEAARVLKPSGLFFFHTFNRNFLSWLIVIKGVEWFVRNTPRHLHVLRLFLKPEEVRASCARHALNGLQLRGVRPVFGRSFWKMLLTRRVAPGFAFTFTPSTRLGFSGMAQKSSETQRALPASFR
ncbi:MAG TPA: bifunctional 2-polyprenyl-6-hydroxyphenol methylase/3-demethylubiquinol 3-O-methyltransferase UbiG [Polyangiaceae bacterium]